MVICSHSLSKKNRIYNRLSVNSIAHSRNQVFIFLPVLVPEIKQNSSVIGCFSYHSRYMPHHLQKVAASFGVSKARSSSPDFSCNAFCIVICHDFEHYCINIRLTFKIIFILYQSDRLSFFQLSSLYGPVPTGLRKKSEVCMSSPSPEDLEAHSHGHVVRNATFRRISLKDPSTTVISSTSS